MCAVELEAVQGISDTAGDGSYPWHRRRPCQSDKYLEQLEKVVLNTTDTEMWDPAVVLRSSQLLI